MTKGDLDPTRQKYEYIADHLGCAIELVEQTFLHDGRLYTTLDLMEEVRAPLCDRVLLSLVNRRQLKPGHLQYEETGAVLLTDEGRKLVLTVWQERKRSELRHSWLDERIPLGMVLQVQAQILARHLRGDLSDYAGWLWG